MVKAHIILGAPLKQKLKLNREENEIFIGVDRGAYYLINQGIYPDLAIGDFDSISIEEKEEIQRCSKIFKPFKEEKEDTDTELALIHTTEIFQPDSITVHNWLGGRIDHLIGTLFLVMQPRFKEVIPILRLVNENNVLSFFLPGEHIIQKEEQMHYISFIGMTELKELALKDFKYPLKKTDYSYPPTLISNEFLDKTGSFSFDKGIVAVVQSKD